MFFDSRRSTIHARNGMVATSQPLAAMAGLQTMMQGGNAVDATAPAWRGPPQPDRGPRS
jgi:gamma-glutamyltranspeptidase/glutathione hydrolase